MNFTNVLKLLDLVGPVTAALPEFKRIYDDIVATFSSPADQAKLREAYEDLIVDNDAGHRRLQDKLAKASRE